MALKQLILHKRIANLKSQLETVRAKDADFSLRGNTLKTREAELETAVNELTAEASSEEKNTVDEAVAAFETDKASLETEQSENETEKKRLEDEIQTLQRELDEIDSRTAGEPAAPAPETERKIESMSTRTKMGQTMEQRAAYLAKPEVKEFYSRVRELISNKRTVTGAELGIPEITLSLLRDNINRYSKLMKHINVKPVAGTARQTIMGSVPEGVWTEAVSKLNDLDLSFTQIEVDGYKVGGYIPVPNSTLQDSDIALANEIEDALGQAIGLAVDRAVLYGTGTKMPIGIVTRLVQTSQPSGWGTNAPTWTDLHTTNILSLNPASYSTAQAYYAALLLKLTVAAPNYSTGNLFWAMNRKTYMTLVSKVLEFNANAALVSGVDQSMPIIGGAIEILDFLSDYDIIGGYGSLYLLAERKGASIAVSEHVMFIEDQTVFKGTARYDGQPVFGEGFVAVNINNSTVASTKSFPSDDANP